MIGKLKPVQIAEQQHLHDLLDSGLVRDWSMAIDGGAHIGGWTMIMADRFESVVAVEPSEAFEHLAANCAGLANVRPIHAALGFEPGRAQCFAPAKHKTLTARQCIADPDGPVEVITIDSLKLRSCGLIKLDTEGWEYDALRGARWTIRKHRPTILCEMAGIGRDADARDWLVKHGYREAFVRGVDVGFVPQ